MTNPQLQKLASFSGLLPVFDRHDFFLLARFCEPFLKLTKQIGLRHRAYFDPSKGHSNISKNFMFSQSWFSFFPSTTHHFSNPLKTKKARREGRYIARRAASFYGPASTASLGFLLRQNATAVLGRVGAANTVRAQLKRSLRTRS